MLILLCNLALLPFVFIILSQFNLINNYEWFSVASIIVILAIYFSFDKTKTFKLLQIINSFLLLLLIFVLFYHLGYDLLDKQSIKISLKMQISLFVLASSFWLLTFLITNSLNKQKNSTNLNTLLRQSLLQPSIMLSLLTAVILSISSLLLLQHLAIFYPAMSMLEVKFLQRGIIPPLTLLLFFWGLLLMFGKLLSLWQQKLSPNNSSIVIVIKNQTNLNDNFWQILSDIAESFYEIPRYINYAIPILGFIGTVLGISLSAEGIAAIISSPQGLTAANQDLGAAISPLGIAFDTTLIALSLGLILSLIQTVVQRFEVSLLNDLQIKHLDEI